MRKVKCWNERPMALFIGMGGSCGGSKELQFEKYAKILSIRLGPTINVFIRPNEVIYGKWA